MTRGAVPRAVDVDLICMAKASKGPVKPDTSLVTAGRASLELAGFAA